MWPVTSAAALSISGGSTLHRPEDLIRDAHRLLAACGVERGHGWVSRTVRSYSATAAFTGLPFGVFLLNQVEANAQQRQAVQNDPAVRNLLIYRDPTGETAVKNVLRGGRP